MARRTITQVFDDLDGQPLREGSGCTIRFSLGDNKFQYQLDLSHDNAAEFHKLIQPYVDAATIVSDSDNAVSTAAVREWAKDNGFEVSQRGNLKKEVYQAYFRSRGATVGEVGEEIGNDPGSASVHSI